MRYLAAVMGTVFQLEVDDDVARAVVDEVFKMWTGVEERFSTFLSTSQISRIGRGELAIDDADPEVRQVLTMCEEIEETTAGRFSIRPGRPDGPGIDPAGYVKGWSVDEAALMLQARGVVDFMIYAGGDVFCSGSPTNDDQWRIGVRHPTEREAIGATISLNRGAVATSGEYERGSHIWGPRVSETSILGVTVVGPSLGVADALATAIFADQATTLDWLGLYPDYGIILFDVNGDVRWSASLAEIVEIPSP